MKRFAIYILKPDLAWPHLVGYTEAENRGEAASKLGLRLKVDGTCDFPHELYDMGVFRLSLHEMENVADKDTLAANVKIALGR
jgi:hypothetical protein